MMKLTVLYAAAALLLGAGACCEVAKTTKSGLDPEAFRTEIAGAQTALYTLTNKAGAEVCVTNLGGRIVSLMVPDRTGELRDVVLGFDNIADYRDISNNFGATIGRYGNRIGQGRFVIDGDTTQLAQNNYGHCLHGGNKGWDTKVFAVKEVTPNSITLEVESPDGDENFPGKVMAQVTYTLTDDNAVEIAYEAETDRPTVLNLTNHSYFCLSGTPEKGSMNDILQINASNYTPVDSTFMTTGEIAPVAGTPMDFTTAQRIGERIDDFTFEQLKNGRGYDHNWVLDAAGDMSKCAARLMSPETGIVLEVYTDEPGVQFYAGNFLDGTVTGKGGIAYPARASVCLETQHYPDSPNKPEWPSVVVRPGDKYTSHCTYKFSVEK